MNPMQAPNVGPGGEDFGNREKPRVKFCWICGGKLALPYFTEDPIPKISGDDIPRIMHKSCFKRYKKGDFSDFDYHYRDPGYKAVACRDDDYSELYF